MTATAPSAMVLGNRSQRPPASAESPGYQHSRSSRITWAAGWPGQDSRPRTAGPGQPGQDGRARTAGTRLDNEAMGVSPTGSFTLRATGAFSLAESSRFGFGQRDDPDFDGVMRLAFRLDGGFEAGAGVELRQDGSQLHGLAYGV